MKTFKIQILFLLSLFFISCSTESEDFEVTVKASNQLGKVSGSGIYGFKKDPNMSRVVAETGVYCVLMHMRRDPNNMHENPHYNDVVEEVFEELKESIAIAKNAGVKDDKIILDPGIGFAKDFNHNMELLKKLDKFIALGYPLLMGVSRKRFIGAILDAEPNDRLEGSLAVASYIATKVPSILRVHDVKETVKTLKVINSINGFKS